MLKERFFYGLFALSALLSIIAVLMICVFLFANALPTISQIGFVEFIFGFDWYPSEELFGIFAMIIGSLYVSALAIFIGVPLGVLSAIYLSYFANQRLKAFLIPAVELLGAIPSVVYGFFGLVIIVPFLSNLFDGTSGKSILAASLVLAIMILPTIILLSKSAIDALPKSYYEGALGASKERSVFFALELCLLLVFCFVLARFLTSWILNPIKNINLEQIDKKGVYTELHSFIKKIKSQNKTMLVLRLIADFKAQNLKENQILQMQLKDCECEIIFSPIFVEGKFKGLMILIQNLSREKDAQNLRKEFSANVTHELKTPLTSILASSEMIKNHLVKAEDTPHFIDRIYKESKRLLEMIDEILLLSFFDENKQESLQKEQVSLKKIILNVISRLNAVAKSHNIQLNSDLEDIEILGVYELLENLIYNLCDNAIKYNKQNGFVHISLKKEQNQIKLSVKDSGIGIKKEHQARIFERFFCVDKSRSKSLGGTGLGLSIVKHACLYHKAKINLQSKLGEGSEFCIIFEG